MQKQSILKTLGPGILFAGAAVGVSHLVQSTRAGAAYGFSLLGLIVLINFLKFPFFEYGHRFTHATGKSLLEGYRQQGRWVIAMFFFMTIVTSVVTVAAVLIVTAGLTEFIFSTGLPVAAVSAILLAIMVALLFIGKYPLLDKTMKVMIILLTISTFIALGIAAKHGAVAPADFPSPNPWTLASIPFLLALMGWMPAPIEITAWQSLWILARKKQTGHKASLRDGLIDFYSGYIGTLFLAVGFLSLGALVMFGSGTEFAASGTKFAGQVVSIYTSQLGEWSKIFISVAALITMFSTTLTVLDAYPRSLRDSFQLSFSGAGSANSTHMYWGILLLLSVLAVLIISKFTGAMKSLIDLATIVSFLAAPIFAFFNYKTVTSSIVPEEAQPPIALRIISWIGIFFLTGFSLAFLIYKL